MCFNKKTHSRCGSWYISMLKVEEVFADFQYIGHRTLELTFKYPREQFNNDDIEIFVDYNIVHKNDRKENYFGVVVYKIKICSSTEDMLYLELEGAFIGNKKAYSFKVFEEMLTVNGVSSLSQIARLQIMNILTHTGLKETITIPMMNIIELNRKKGSKLQEH